MRKRKSFDRIYRIYKIYPGCEVEDTLVSDPMTGEKALSKTAATAIL